MSEEEILSNMKLIPYVIRKYFYEYLGESEEENENISFYGLEGYMQGVNTYDGSTQKSTYLCTCIKHNICKQLRSRNFEKRRLDGRWFSYDKQMEDVPKEGFWFHDKKVNVEKEIEKKLMFEKAVEIIDKLPKLQSEPIKYCYGLIDGTEHTRKEYSEYSGRSLGAIKFSMQIGIDKLKEGMTTWK